MKLKDWLLTLPIDTLWQTLIMDKNSESRYADNNLLKSIDLTQFDEFKNIKINIVEHKKIIHPVVRIRFNSGYNKGIEAVSSITEPEIILGTYTENLLNDEIHLYGIRLDNDEIYIHATPESFVGEYISPEILEIIN